MGNSEESKAGGYPPKAPLTSSPSWPPGAAAGPASPLPGGGGFRTSFAGVSLHMQDRIRLMRFSEPEIAQVRDIIASGWHKGIQEERMYDKSHEFKLYGFPWNTDVDRLQARQLMTRLLAGLYAMGWVLKGAVDVSKKESDKDTMIFRRQHPPPPPALWTCISFDGSDKLKIIEGAPELSQTLINKIGASRVYSAKARGPAFEIRIGGINWRPSGAETVQVRIFLMVLLEVLESCGFSLYASLNQDGGNESSDSDTWYCIRQPNWTAGAPVYH